MRLSPFDQAHRRHTSFAGVIASPLLADDADLEIDEGDLRIDTYRAQGAGGQHVNKTDSAVRITHLPTGIVAQCQNERSQAANKQTAMRILKSRLAELAGRGTRGGAGEGARRCQNIGFGGEAVRSYVLHPYQQVKDERTDSRWATPRGCSTATSTGSSTRICWPRRRERLSSRCAALDWPLPPDRRGTRPPSFEHRCRNSTFSRPKLPS